VLAGLRVANLLLRIVALVFVEFPSAAHFRLIISGAGHSRQ
jgi:hypothetical protein